VSDTTTPLNLVIDVGNTRAKAATFRGNECVEKMFYDSMDDLYLLGHREFENILVSSVNHPSDEILSKLNAFGKKIVLDNRTPLPLKIRYATPETLGVDRIAAACGALELFPLQNTLIVDAGTCINYEFVDHQGHYHGGTISPGIDMRFKAMHKFTARLPLISLNKQVGLIGDSTESCMQSGVLYGVLGEIEGIVARYQEKYTQLAVAICGGDAGLFENRLKPTIFAAPDLVLMGLNRILRYNAS
jgi:type III pantothenate kinase